MQPPIRAVPAIALPVLVALALTGCTAETDAAPEPTPTTTAAETATPAARSNDGASTATITDPAEAKAAALAAGRPEPAWDKNCVAWQMPDPDTDPLALQTAETYLGIHDADCPDAIVWPHYYIDGFRDGGPGEVVVDLDPEVLPDSYVDPDSDSGMVGTAYDVLAPAVDAGLDIDAVTVNVTGTDRTYTESREWIEYKRSRGY